ncbi:hypothetical protein CCR85_07800 [Rhodothalassium salexigens]|uniref:pseudouridine synthase n=1 Tax=Rhodothalassium salexigens TaxID=1086 RepID=UPI001912B63C|nr:pseudouridine synthase [Rhodothalassium salexigens]MBK5911396.1 hypothetical protein [Rhodothalassium salexigens]
MTDKTPQTPPSSADRPAAPGSEATGPEATAGGGERIAKALARAGIGSRRDVERLIEAGRVRVDGEVLKTPAFLIDRLDRVRVDNKPVAPAEPTRMWRFYKPRGVVTTARDPEGRPTIADRLPASMPRVVCVGRLDLNTEGLLLLTNDGALARWMELPATGLPRRYRVRVFGQPDPAALAGLAQGVTVDGVTYGPVKVAVVRRQTSNAWLDVTLHEGKNREIRKLMAHLGLDVNRLIRLGYGPFTLGQMKPGQVDGVPVKALRAALGGYFGDEAATGDAAPGLVAPAPDPSKWARAKAKPKTGPKAKAKAKSGKRDHRQEDRADSTRAKSRPPARPRAAETPPSDAGERRRAAQPRAGTQANKAEGRQTGKTGRATLGAPTPRPHAGNKRPKSLAPSGSRTRPKPASKPGRRSSPNPAPKRPRG